MTLEHFGRESGDSLLVATNSLEPTAILDSKSASVYKRHSHHHHHAQHSQISRCGSSNQVNTTSSSSISSLYHDHNTNRPHFNLVYFLLYNLIIWTIRTIRSTRVYLLALVYYFVENYLLSYKFLARLLVENKYLSELCNNRPSGRIQMPGHVCVIVNCGDDQMLTSSQLFSLYTRIVDSLLHYDNGRAQLQTISFYMFDNEINESTQRRINAIYCPKDLNNNNSDGGAVVKNSLTINFLTYSQSGRATLVNACQSLASKVKTGQLSLEEISVELVDKQLQELVNLREPEMILSIGEADSLAGFSAWHTRLSEIIKIPSYLLVNKLTVREALLKYNKIEKRFGK